LSPSESEKRGQSENEIESGENAEVSRLLEHQEDVNARILARLEKIEQLLDNNS
jgi:hypothetical protein